MKDSKVESIIFVLIIVLSILTAIFWSGNTSTEELYRQECSQMLNC